jgi:hypothetical protein
MRYLCGELETQVLQAAGSFPAVVLTGTRRTATEMFLIHQPSKRPAATQAAAWPDRTIVQRVVAQIPWSTASDIAIDSAEKPPIPENSGHQK